SAMLGSARGTEPPLAIGRLGGGVIGADVSHAAWPRGCAALSALLHGAPQGAGALARGGGEHIPPITGPAGDPPLLWPPPAALATSPPAAHVEDGPHAFRAARGRARPRRWLVARVGARRPGEAPVRVLRARAVLHGPLRLLRLQHLHRRRARGREGRLAVD